MFGKPESFITETEIFKKSVTQENENFNALRYVNYSKNGDLTGVEYESDVMGSASVFNL